MNVKNPRLSIVVPIYNTEAYLPQCIESILGQTYTEFELILVDDGSKDDSGRICDEYAKKDSRIKVVHKENGGAISARKAGLECALGQYVGFVDGDDWIDAKMYETLCAEAFRYKADIVITDNDMWQGNRVIQIKQGVRAGLYNKGQLIEELYPNLVFKEKIYNLGVSPSLCTKITKRELLVKYQFMVDERITGGDDAACIFPCILEADSLFYVKDYFPYHYRVHKKSMTHRKKMLNMEERLAIMKHMDVMAKEFPFPGVKRQMGFYAIAVMQGLLINVIECNMLHDSMSVQIVANSLKENAAWHNICELYEDEQLPERTKDVIQYVKDLDECALKRLKFAICVEKCKQIVKKVIYRE